MKEITIKKYMADDGKIFDTLNACKEHENKGKKFKEFKSTLIEIQTICKETDCNLCPFIKRSGCMFRFMPDEWEIDDCETED